MKLRLDQNLSHRLRRALADGFPDAMQVKRAGLDQADDDTIWKYARREGLTIVTMDADFPELAVLRGAPPKVIWLRCGNRPTRVIETLLRPQGDLIASFVADDQATCFELY